jgi:hypothetical protein
MKLESQVTSLELSRKLESLGVKQESLFYWWISNKEEHKNHINFQPAIHYERPIPMKDKNWDWSIVSAFTVAELGEMLPERIAPKTGVTRQFAFRRGGFKWVSYELQDGYIVHKEFAETEADARAAMLIWLVENGYLKESK